MIRTRLAKLRDVAWAAFWNRQRRHLPPSVQIAYCTICDLPEGAIGIAVGELPNRDTPLTAEIFFRDV